MLRLYRLCRGAWGSGRPRKRKLNKSNVKSKTPAFHFQSDGEKDDEKASPKQQSLQNERQKTDHVAGLPRHNRAIALHRALTSHHPRLPVVSGKPKWFLLLPNAAFHWGREKD